MSARRTIANVLKTLAFLLAYWSVFLIGLPLVISVAEIAIGLQRFPAMPLLAAALLLLSTALALWSALTLAVAGDGTPLAIDPTQVLVTTGPYAYVRHPFAIASTAQIVALGIALGSIPVIGYAAVAMALWYYLMRRREERDLEARFGESARDYRLGVRGFRPHLHRYRVP